MYYKVYNLLKSKELNHAYAKSLEFLVMMVITLRAERLKLGSHSKQKSDLCSWKFVQAFERSEQNDFHTHD